MRVLKGVKFAVGAKMRIDYERVIAMNVCNWKLI